ncbi:bacterio-opsin activator [Halorientalis sp. IM1011]|uniref:bacterio-opsin activator domain-containing protein n=1 Tax=Halorientalis sp. IM1011 TaxID=1932360 RepID=UPI00097CC473|nr:bacterio-opsin activator domain-containing protein [Halorientalis sp. IM1011]AQL41517.1 bacterio-opsin activator [Halorientalis sp. IM1011]
MNTTGGIDSASILFVGEAAWLERVVETFADRTGATIGTVATKAAALDRIRDAPPDCVVVAYELPNETGIDLLRDIDQERERLPVVLGAQSGSESVASEAIGAGVTDYVAVPDRTASVGETFLERTERAVLAAGRRATQRDRARQFDAIFDDARTATWVLDPDGSLVRANRTARELIDTDTDRLVGRPFWTLPWWPESDGTAEDVRRIVETALDGRYGNAVVVRSAAGDESRVVDLSVRPVTNDRGEIVSIVAEGVDVTERVDLERDLRASEELHRVTLNNMTDTILITDEAGEYTYVCPNVHFIFGYTAEEIHEMGSIDELLGEDLFDREALEREGVLKNIECTATDSAGREHTLLVNVREVDIQDGSLLYSCRDITKRKQREAALTTLQETARDLLYAETHREIAQGIVDDAPNVLDLDASAVYLFDAEANHLEPAAYSGRMESLNGPLPTVHADGTTLPSHCFLENEPLWFDDVHESDRLDNRATDLRSAIYVPLGDHGVFVAGSETVGAVDEITRELADLLAATAEAALDRVRRESKLREQDRTLQRQNEQLTRLNRINETIREIDRAVVRAETREEIYHAVCERLVDDRYGLAWIGTTDPADGTLDPQARAGDGRGYLDGRTFDASGAGTEPAERTAATGSVTNVSNVASGLREEAWRKDALTRDYLSVLSIPLVYNDLSHGVLTVYAETQDAFDETARAVLEELGETIAAALSAIERKNALLTTAVTRVEFAVEDPSFVMSRLARETGCTLSYEGGLRQSAEGSHVFVTVEGADPAAVESAATELAAVDDVQRISTNENGGILRLGLARPFFALDLADHGAVCREVVAEPTGTTLVVDVPESVEVQNVAGLVRDLFSEVELRAKQTLDHAGEYDFYAKFLDDVTERQLEVVQTAYYSGFFESPRESTGEDVAAALDISPPAFYQHSRTVQRKLFAALFDDDNLSVAAPQQRFNN